MDITDFYLDASLSIPQFNRIYTDTYPPAVLSRLALLPFLKVDRSGCTYCLFRIDKTMYGLKESGRLSNIQLVSLLNTHGFFETTTPCLFRHLSRPITFVLVVDNFGVKYHNRSDYDFLLSALSSQYAVKSHPIGTQFLGLRIDNDLVSRALTLSYPGYVAALLTRLRPHGVSPTASPYLYTPPCVGI
jgi:hypothetical protein